MRISLFATCLIDIFFPDVGESVVRLLRRLGCEVDFPMGQVCCGQPAFNSGHQAESEQMAANQIEAFAQSEYVVTPSGSCAGMIRTHYPAMFKNRPEMRDRARALAAKTYELSEFLVRILKVDLRLLNAHFAGVVTYHRSCHMARELAVIDEPLTLLQQVKGVEYRPLERADLCCGFGGTFSVKLPEVAVAMADDKLDDIRATQAEFLVGSDCACLMHIQGRLNRSGAGPQIIHLAQLLEQATRSKAGAP